ncbi:sulfotransferase domain-containing protein [Cytophaga aurantiaca]|uniref:sulfotransferase domain-containing protein n=1 Tax=Cytophaga aurantiaca TaxID=29530 RepID=UPI000374C8E8|nr:sulfotransferase domain-containing protein [Cytophaga aurantiaca]
MSKKVWLASFPRSGNTFFRNILFHVYGIESIENENRPNTSAAATIFVKTHDLPFLLKTYSKTDQVIYLVRDGRDSICSLANHRKNLIDVNSDLAKNYEEATKAEHGSFFGGWDLNCKFWLQENPILIRFEDLITDPKKEFAKIEHVIDLPKANWENLPTFEKQKNAEARFGNFLEEDPTKSSSQKFFRKGAVGGWKEELSVDLQKIFWTKSQETMEALGYTNDGSVHTIDAEKINRLKVKSLLKEKIKLRYIHTKSLLKKLFKSTH